MKTPRFTTPLAVLSLTMVPWVCQGQRTYESQDGFYEYGGSTAFGTPHQSQGWTAYAATEWVSRYLERGYQRFGNSGAIGIMLGGGYGPVGADLEQRIADAGGDREFRGNLRARHRINELEVAARATYITDLRGSPSSWDLAFGAGSELIWGLRWESELCYGTETKNFYADAELAREWELHSEWTFKVSTGLGANLGYQRNAAKGIDHAVVGFDIARALGTNSTLYGGVSHYAPINRDAVKYLDHRDLYDGFVFQVGARWDY